MASLPSLDVEHLSCLTHYLDKLYQVLYNDLYIVHDQEIYSSKTTCGNKFTLACSVCYSSISGRYNYLNSYSLQKFTQKNMTDLAAANDISAFQAILWCFYPIGLLVGVELLLRAINDNDDDDRDGGKMIPAMSPS